MAEEIVPFKDLAKQQLLERCRELEFADDVQDLRCTRCNRLALEQWYTNCGHTLCPNCKRLLSGGKCRCPNCGQFILHIENQSADFEEKVNGFRVKCPNCRYGCPLVTTVKQLQEHLIVCEWTKEKALPAVYRGDNTTQLLLEEVSKLKNQIGDMHGTIDFLLKELHRRQEVEEEIKKSMEMTVADIKSHLKGLHFETTTLNAQTKDINFEQLQFHFSSKEEVKQQNQQMAILDGKTNALFQILDEKLDKFSQRLTKEIENIDNKIKAGVDKMEVMRNEDKISMDRFQQKQIVACENNKKELLLNNKHLQDIVEKCNDDLKMDLHKLSSELTLGLEQQGTSFSQKLSLEVKQLEEKILKNKLNFEEESKENGVQMEAMINDFKRQEVVLMKHIQDKTKDFVSKEKLKQLQETVTKMNSNNKLLIHMLDQKEDRFSQKLTKEVESIDAKMVTSEGRMEDALTKSRKETAAISKDLQGKVEKFSEELKAQWQILSSGLNQKLEEHEISFNQKLSNEVKQLDEKINKNKTADEMYEKENHAKMEVIKDEMKRQEVELKQLIATNVKNMQENFQGSIEKFKQQLVKVQGLNQEQLQCNQKLPEELQSLNSHLNQIEVFEKGAAIEDLLNRKSSVEQLVDSFLFGSAHEQMVFQSLCLKWTIKQKDLFIPNKGSQEHTSDIFPVYGFKLKAQLKLTIDSGGNIYLGMSSKGEEENGQEVDIKPLPMVTFITKDLSGCNKHLIICTYHQFNKSLQNNPISYCILISKSQRNAFISRGGASLEVLVLVEPMTIMKKPLSVDGSMTHTIEHYSRKLQMAREELIGGHWSPCFLTHAGGYRVAVKIWLNAHISIRSKGLVARICFLSGEFDSQLKNEFGHETSVMLINQLDARKNITVKTKAMMAKYYRMTIASEDAIGSGGFLVNDSLTYHMTIKPI